MRELKRGLLALADGWYVVNYARSHLRPIAKSGSAL